MGSSQATQTCPVCGIELLERNMVKHRNECSKLSAKQGANSCIYFDYQGPDKQMTYKSNESIK
jgi:hypothetical protein